MHLLWLLAAVAQAYPVEEALASATTTADSVLRFRIAASALPEYKGNNPVPGTDAGRLVGADKEALQLSGALSNKQRGRLSKLEMHMAGAAVQRGFADTPPEHMWVDGHLDPRDKEELKLMVLEEYKEQIRSSRAADNQRDDDRENQRLQDLWYGNEDSKRQAEEKKITKQKVQRQWNYDALSNELENGVSALRDRAKVLDGSEYFKQHAHEDLDVAVTLVTPVDSYGQQGVEKTRVADNRRQYCDLHEHKVKCVSVNVETKPNPESNPHSSAGGGWQAQYDASIRYLDAIISVLTKSEQVPLNGVEPLAALEQLKADANYNEQRGHQEWLWLLDNNALITHPSVDVTSWVLSDEVLAQAAVPGKNMRYGDGYYDPLAKTSASTRTEEGDEGKKKLEHDPIMVIAADNLGGFDLSSFFINKNDRHTYQLLHLWRTFAADLSRDSDLHRFDGRTNARLKNALYKVFKQHAHLRDRVAVVPSRLMASQMYSRDIQKASIENPLKDVDNPQETEKMNKVDVPVEIAQINQWTSSDFVATRPRECPGNLKEWCVKYTQFWAAASLANESNN